MALLCSPFKYQMVNCINTDTEMPCIQCHKCHEHVKRLTLHLYLGSAVVRRAQGANAWFRVEDPVLLLMNNYLAAIIVGDQCIYPSLSSPFVLAQEAPDGWALLDAAMDSLPTVKGY